MSLLSPSAPTGHPKAFQSWHWVFLAAILLAVVAISTFYFSNAQAQTADGTITGLTLTSEDYPSWTSDHGNVYPAGTATTIDITGLKHETEYKIRMRTRYYEGEKVDSSRSGDWAKASLRVAGNPEPAPTPEPAQEEEESTLEPGTIVVLTATDDETGRLVLSWPAPAAPHAEPTDYHVNWARNADEYPSDTEEDGNTHPTTTTHTLDNLEYDTDYKVRVRARYTDCENADSPWNGPWTKTTAQVIQPLPAAPSIMGTALTPEGQVMLLWQNPSDDSITGYQMLRGPDADSLVVIEEDTGSSGTTYTDKSPPAGQTHTYGVKARNSSGLSPRSNTVTATVPAVEQEEEPVVSARQNQELFLVSNLDASRGSVVPFGFASATDTARMAQSFSAANNADGSSAEFDFHAVTVLLEGSGGETRHLAASDLLVTVHSNTSGQPGDLLYTLIPPVPLTVLGDGGPVTFTAPPGSTLSSGITYWLKLEAAADSTYFDGDHIFVARASDEDVVQGPTTDNRRSAISRLRRNRPGEQVSGAWGARKQLTLPCCRPCQDSTRSALRCSPASALASSKRYTPARACASSTSFMFSASTSLSPVAARSGA